ncbi:MAG: hypothetical protein CM15mP47_4830 [Methanobacteriota archaeon]|nr:MAG: hypothetical protein CM15mP47_4830 [Euryarchaeota archaeon]
MTRTLLLLFLKIANSSRRHYLRGCIFDERAVVTGGGIGVSANARQYTTVRGIEAAGVTTSHGVGVQDFYRF